ncbi:MAG: DUF2330 domain-containing protein [Armatimonadetes bacterium]|nr:DUF2330 domain-containing protein [Armatimonadota bacterium]
MPRLFRSVGFVLLFVTAGASPALACAALIGPNGAVNLVRTTTLAGYHDGIEHYITSFSFQGGDGKFGSIVPLPGIPTKVERGGGWTLQRLIRETQPRREVRALLSSPASERDGVRVILETRIDALDITILEGGGAAVGRWARDHGFILPPDAPEVLDFYAGRSPIFMAARFDADAAKQRGQQIGDGTPIHLTIPVENPWVPLRILALGKQGGDLVQADVYLLTDIRPAFLPGPRRGMFLQYSAPASPELMRDLRSDKGMGWLPASGMWLTHLAINSAASDLTYDLAVDAGAGTWPSRQPGGIAPALAVGMILSAVWVTGLAWAWPR